jgi:hypothetical protein
MVYFKNGMAEAKMKQASTKDESESASTKPKYLTLIVERMTPRLPRESASI